MKKFLIGSAGVAAAGLMVWDAYSDGHGIVVSVLATAVTLAALFGLMWLDDKFKFL